MRLTILLQRLYAAGWLIGLVLAACAGPMDRGSPPVPSQISADLSEEQTPATLPELLTQIEDSYRRGNYDRGLVLVKRALELKQADVSSLDRIGSVYYLLGRYGEALTIWRQALPLERNLQRRRELGNSIAVARRSLGLAHEEPPLPQPRTRLKVKKPRRRPDRRQIQDLYKKGIRYYARGEYLQATTAFLRILELDPGNGDATKALERLRLEPGADRAPTGP
ncbi:MAG: hypothetical protein A3J74_09905 [Elusimicrobia bacterium RIFCSPHIGHO2_02_FULL_57_9]|nr:MAG: hypothetical protein A3J74_09905 [Elusimicrobia bacterium RIFCSPHIGHO2_02_FULL_57_9]